MTKEHYQTHRRFLIEVLMWVNKQEQSDPLNDWTRWAKRRIYHLNENIKHYGTRN